ncbi:hypothetical protein [Geomicrobium sp. JCM 19039]|uniref:hypothetical protein n=1 Tax=Geomicrobium sp. JCM 19039 TaxID=1460636 RepID=UPI00045F19EE|nr:hypothetical protein [Geomicrobium sp. JCM 19039]GAK12267.1 hypothetical protein JCM19039_2024 [Geomicrobium sp. JCM 19039]
MVKRLVIIIFIVLLAIVSISLYGLWDRSNQYADVLYQHSTTPSQIPAQPLDTNGYTPISTDYEVRYEQDGGATPLFTIAEAYESNDGTESLYQLQFQLHFHDHENTPLTNRRATLKVYSQNFWEYEDGLVYGTYTTSSGDQQLVPLHADAHFTSDHYTINANYYKNIDG